MTFVNLIQSAPSLPINASALESSISALERQITAIESSSISLERLLPFFTGLVALGLALEFWLIWREYRNEKRSWARGTICSPEKPSLKQFVVAVLSVLLITGGIVGELWVSIRVTSINGTLRSKNAELRSESDQLLALLTRQAGDAAASARIAREHLQAVETQSGAIQERLIRASKQLSEIEERVRVQGPRWRILSENKATFVQEMKAFNGIRLTVISCGASSPIEQWVTEQKLLELLGKGEIGAGWNTGYDSWNECPSTTSNGLEIILNSIADEDLKKAARALGDELNGLSIATSLDFLPNQTLQFMANVLGADSPWARAVRDQSRIFLLVGPNAMADNVKPSKRETKNK